MARLFLNSLSGTEDLDQRTEFRRAAEDASYYSQGDLIQDRNGIFLQEHVEQLYQGWKFLIEVKRTQGRNGTSSEGRVLGYVKTKLDKDGVPYATSFSALPAEDHEPVILAPVTRGQIVLKY